MAELKKHKFSCKHLIQIGWLLHWTLSSCTFSSLLQPNCFFFNPVFFFHFDSQKFVKDRHWNKSVTKKLAQNEFWTKSTQIWRNSSTTDNHIVNTLMFVFCLWSDRNVRYDQFLSKKIVRKFHDYNLLCMTSKPNGNSFIFGIFYKLLGNFENGKWFEAAETESKFHDTKNALNVKHKVMLLKSQVFADHLQMVGCSQAKAKSGCSKKSLCSNKEYKFCLNLVQINSISASRAFRDKQVSNKEAD